MKDLYSIMLFGHIKNGRHRRSRRLGAFKYLLRNIGFLFRKDSALEVKAPAVLMFASILKFDVTDFHRYKVLYYKQKGEKASIDFFKEEYLLNLAFLIPALRVPVCNRVVRRLEAKLDRLNLVALVCEFPEIITNFVGHILKQRRSASIITMMHGIYKPDFYKPYYFEKEIADYVIVWGQIYKDVYVKHGLKPEQIKIFAAPIVVIEEPKVIDAEKLKPVFLGQQLYQFYAFAEESYNTYVGLLADYYARRGIRLNYKPHPREDITKSLNEANRSKVTILRHKNVDKAFFDDFDVAYAINSTAIIHALGANIRCFQVNLGLQDLPDIRLENYCSLVQVNAGNLEEVHDRTLKRTKVWNSFDAEFIHVDPQYKKYNSQVILSCFES